MELSFLFTMGLAIVLGWAGAAKVFSPADWRAALAKYALPGFLFAVAGMAVPSAELLAAALLLASLAVPALQPIAALSSMALLVLFSFAIVRLRARVGNRLPCGCFGRRTERDYRVVVVRNLIFLMMSLYLYADAAQALPRSDVRLSLPMLLVAAGVVLAGWVVSASSSALKNR